ncbi:MAG: arylsulfatase A-like enzyme [Planctomycetota bacterium]|jgi:arylsulfatase A-like enzyme
MYLYPRDTTAVHVDGGQHALGRALGLDDLAEQAVLFANAFAPSADPIASLAAVHTGRSPLETGISADGDGLPTDGKLLAERMRELGFQSAAFVTHETELDASWQRGFDHFARYTSDFDTLGQALNWVGEHDYGTGQPTLVWLHLNAPAFPFEPKAAPAGNSGTQDFAQRYGDPAYDGAADGTQAYREQHAQAEVMSSTADRERITALYDGEVAMTTHLLFAFLDFFRYAGEPAGVWEESLFVFAGTNGVELFRRPGRWGETRSLGDETIRVPLFIRHPDSLTGRRVLSQVVQLQDLYPTLIEFFGGEVDAGLQARSLLALTDRDHAVAFMDRPAIAILGDQISGEGTLRDGGMRSVRDAEWHWIEERAADGTVRVELYKVTEDPYELRNLAEREPERVVAMRAAFESASHD